MDVVERSESSSFVIENVKELKGCPEREQIEKRAIELGFETGVPRSKRRKLRCTAAAAPNGNCRLEEMADASFVSSGGDLS